MVADHRSAYTILWPWQGILALVPPQIRCSRCGSPRSDNLGAAAQPIGNPAIDGQRQQRGREGRDLREYAIEPQMIRQRQRVTGVGGVELHALSDSVVNERCSPLGEGHVGHFVRADVVGAGADEFVVAQVLDAVAAPPAHAAHREQRREEVDIQP